ncbi:MAG: type III polyketide synthase [Alphaproteobacteria bacterium]|nr:type III polyketide synthase [Alphaproteobacteria bacterium]
MTETRPCGRNGTYRANVISLATAVPRHRLAQSDAAELAREAFAHRFPDFGRIARVFKTTGIQSRYVIKPIEWYLDPMGWPERTAAYLEGAQDLFVAAAEKAMAAAGCKASDIDCVVTVSSTGIATPSLEAHVADRIGFRADIERVPVFGLGCAGGVNGLAIASRMAQARPGSTVLMVAVEICSTAFRLDKLTKANMVATALFADGAAACVLRTADSGGIEIEGAAQHMWPDTLNIMGWNIDDQGLGVIFDRDIPPFAHEKVGPAVGGMLQRLGTARCSIDRFACHPGGAKVITALEQTLHLEQGTLDHERSVLSDYGNMSAPTVMFVLERLMAAGLPKRTVMTAMGPGFSCGVLSLVRAA